MRRPSGGPTLHDVAEQAGVSVATASRALSGRGQVSPATASAILHAARSLGYGRGLSDGGGRVAIVTGGLSLQFVEEIVEVLQDAGGRSGAVVVTTGMDGRREHEELSRLLTDASVSAVIVAGGRSTRTAEAAALAAMARAYAAAAKPLVFCGRPALEPGLPEWSFDYDNDGGARAAASYLIGAGHRKILLLRGPRGFSTSDARADGFDRCCEERGVMREPSLTVVGQRDRASGMSAVRAALASGLEFSAVFGESDLLAVGATTALLEAGRRVPEDVSVMGFDDMQLAADNRVPLTTVHVPFAEVGRAAALAALRPDRPIRGTAVLAGTHVVVRESVAVLRA